MKIYLDLVGCRLNQAEIEKYARQFRAAGHSLTSNPEEADLVVINTCAVTRAAAADSRKKIRHAARVGAKEIAVTGCWSTLNSRNAADLQSVQHVISNTQKDHLVSTILNLQENQFDLEPIQRKPIPGTRSRTRAFIKVQDGCDNRCTFCVTTLARGQGSSRLIDDILDDIRAALDASEPLLAAKEIVLTGVHLGSWGQDFSPSLHLRHLVKTILRETNVPRLRLSSLEPWDLDEDFFALWEDPRLCRHLHLPLQSGCQRTLRRMARKTTPRSFSRLVDAARTTIPGIAITTDIMAGFPGETESEFEHSLAFVETMEFAGGHVFTYSPRPGTAAAKMSEQVPHPVRKARNNRLRSVLEKSARRYQQRFVGQTLPVLWESATNLGPGNWQLSGLTDNYLRIHALAAQELWNQITPVRVTQLNGDGLTGDLSFFSNTIGFN